MRLRAKRKRLAMQESFITDKELVELLNDLSMELQ